MEHRRIHETTCHAISPLLLALAIGAPTWASAAAPGGTIETAPREMTSGPHRIKATSAAVLALMRGALAVFGVAACATYASADWFGDPIDTTLPGIANGLAVGPMNGDSYTDAVVTVGNGDIYVLLNDGTGHFSVGAPVHAPNVERVTLGDFDGDGDLDAAAITIESSEDFHVAWNDGNGALSDPVPLPAGGPVYSLSGADVDQDGVDDLIVATMAMVRVFWGDIGGNALASSRGFEASLAPDWPCERDWTVSTAVGGGDLDGDGFLDLVAASYFVADPWLCEEHYGDLGLGLFMSSGSPRDREPVEWIVREPSPFGDQNEIYDFDFGDVDEDTQIDIVAVDSPNGLRPFLNVGGAWIEVAGLEVSRNAVRVADIDANGDMDAALGGGLWIAAGDGTGSFVLEEIPGGSLRPFEFEEFDGSSGVDLAGIVVGTSTLRVFPNSVSGVAGLDVEFPAKSSIRVQPVVASSICWVTLSALRGSTDREAIGIADALGRIVTRLEVPRRPSTVSWDLTDASGRPVPAGIYWAVAPDGLGRARVIVVR